MTYKIVNFYKFVELTDLETLRRTHKESAQRHKLIGTILLAPEGINVGLAGSEWGIEAYRQFLLEDERFADVTFKFSEGDVKPFRNLYVKVKPTIIRFDDDHPLSIDEIRQGKRISPDQLHRIIEDKPADVTLVDTRNWYEADYGSFAGAVTLPIKKFTEFGEAFKERFANDPDRTYIVFCTGGVRCEKVAPWAQKQGFKHVYQVDGGILDYFKKHGDHGWNGKCFVFDQRWLVDGSLKEAADEDNQNLRIQPKPLRS